MRACAALSPQRTGHNAIACLFPDTFQEPRWSSDRRWIRGAQQRNNEFESGRQLQPQTIARISETLGALNTVGKYLVNMTRGGSTVDTSIGGVVIGGGGLHSSGLPQDVPGAIYTISKNVLGRNVTDFIREALPAIAPTVPAPSPSTVSALRPDGTSAIQTTEEGSKNCLTPDGLLG